MKTVLLILFSCIVALSWQLNKTARERDECHALIQAALDLIPRWEDQARRQMASAEYWYQAHMQTIIHYENQNPNGEE